MTTKNHRSEDGVQMNKQLVARSLKPIVRLPDRRNYFPGKGCTCAASSAFDCGCVGVDWTSREEHILRDALEAIKADYEFCKGNPEYGDRASAYYETACAALLPNQSHQRTPNLPDGNLYEFPQYDDEFCMVADLKEISRVLEEYACSKEIWHEQARGLRHAIMTMVRVAHYRPNPVADRMANIEKGEKE